MRLVAVLALCAAACAQGAAATSPAAPGGACDDVRPCEPARAPPPRVAAKVTLEHGDARVGTYVSSPWGFSTSSYWIEGPSGLIAIDTQFLPSAAEEMIAWAEATTHKKFELAIVLHANPDKFNGAAAMKKHGARVVTSEQVRALIPAIHQKRRAAFYDRYKPDYPDTAPDIESFGAATTTLRAGGIAVSAHVMGAGCSEAHVVVEFEGHLFPGDLVANDAHSWLEIGRTDAWLSRIDEMRALGPRFVHPGRGPSGGPGLLDQEETYLRRVISIVADEKPSLPIDDAKVARAKAKVLAAYPGYGFPVFLDIGLPAELERQAKAK